MIARTLTIAWKELLHARKDRVLIPFLILGALAELTLLAWATSQPVDNIPMTVLDQDGTEASAALITALDATDALDYNRDAESLDALYGQMDDRSLLGDSKTVMGVVIPQGYGAMIAAGDVPEVRLVLNGAESVASQTAQRKAEEVIFQQVMRDRYNMEPADYADQLPQVTVKYNEDLEQSWYTLPAEAGLMFYMMTVALAALAISREREMGTYEQLLVKPYRALEVVLGKALAPMAVGYLLFLSMLFLTTVVFGVPLRGSLPLLLVLAVIYLLAEMGKGVLMSMLGRTQLQAVLMVFVIAMVDFVFSGYAVAVETMPQFMRTVSEFVAIRHWLTIMRGIMLKDASVEVLLPDILALVALGTVIMTFTAVQYRRRGITA